MHSLVAMLIPLLVILGVCLILWFVVERFSPDPLISQICKIIIFLVAIVAVLTKLLPMLGFG